MEELFLPRTEFENYEDFFKNYKINVPENFNFSYYGVKFFTSL